MVYNTEADGRPGGRQAEGPRRGDEERHRPAGHGDRAAAAGRGALGRARAACSTAARASSWT